MPIFQRLLPAFLFVGNCAKRNNEKSKKIYLKNERSEHWLPKATFLIRVRLRKADVGKEKPPLEQTKGGMLVGACRLAERQGFEPWVGY